MYFSTVKNVTMGTSDITFNTELIAECSVTSEMYKIYKVGLCVYRAWNTFVHLENFS